MKALVQVPPRHCTDCTICSMATLTGITYEKSLKLMLPKRKKHAGYGASLEDILDCFRKLKITVSRTDNPTIKELKKHAFLVVKVPYKDGWDYHAVIWDAKRKVILDGYHKPKSARFYQKKVLYCFEVK